MALYPQVCGQYNLNSEMGGVGTKFGKCEKDEVELSLGESGGEMENEYN